MFRFGAFIFSFIATMLAMTAVVTAAMAYSHTDTVSRRLDKVAAGGAIGSTAKVILQEYAIKVSPGLVKAGIGTLDVTNVGGITHELVVVRAPSVQALPVVTTAGERSVGAVDRKPFPTPTRWVRPVTSTRPRQQAVPPHRRHHGCSATSTTSQQTRQ
jgi:hypothetical protein